MAIARSALLAAVATALALVLVSGGSDADPRTPPALPGLPPPFLGIAVSGGGGLTAAVDAYGDVADLRAPGPAGRALIDNPAARQAAGTVPADTGIVPRVRIGDGKPLPFWRADTVRQRYLTGSNVVRTSARFGQVRAVARTAASGAALAMVVAVAVRAPAGARVAAPVGVDAEPEARGWQPGDVTAVPSLRVNVEGGLRCRETRGPRQIALACAVGRVPSAPASALLTRAARSDRRWLSRSRRLPRAAPAWARALYARSLLVLHALTDRRTGALAAGARDGWAYVWPRDAATAAIAYARAGYQGEARRVAGFLDGLEISKAARFEGDGTPVPGRGPQGDAAGWVAVAARAAGLRPSAAASSVAWRDRADYQEGSAGTYLGNALAAGAIRRSAPGGPAGWTAAAAGAIRPSPPAGPAVRTAAAERGGRAAAAYRAERPAAAHPAERPAAAGLVERPAAADPAERPGGADLANGSEAGPADRAAPPRIGAEFGTPRGLVRRAGDPSSGLDSAAAWAVRPFAGPALYPAARRTLLLLAGGATRFGITPGAGWSGGEDPWTAPTAWSAWSLAALGEHADALRLLADLRRAATPAGSLPERVDARTGVPRSTTPLAWSHAFAVLALRQLWPGGG